MSWGYRVIWVLRFSISISITIVLKWMQQGNDNHNRFEMNARQSLSLFILKSQDDMHTKLDFSKWTLIFKITWSIDFCTLPKCSKHICRYPKERHCNVRYCFKWGLWISYIDDIKSNQIKSNSARNHLTLPNISPPYVRLYKLTNRVQIISFFVDSLSIQAPFKI